jgi:MarR family transcriptional regulator, organic hydroperoxide resistance regulator
MPVKKTSAPARSRRRSPTAGAASNAAGELMPPRITVYMYRAVARAADMANSRARKFGLTIKGMRVMVALLERSVLRVGDLSELVAVDQSTLSHLLRRMEGDGHLRRTRRAEDNRSVEVELTPQGQKIARKCLEISLQLESVLLHGLSAAEIAVLRRQLARMCANAERELPPPRRSDVIA